jgi:hypothetical protein
MSSRNASGFRPGQTLNINRAPPRPAGTRPSVGGVASGMLGSIAGQDRSGVQLVGRGNEMRAPSFGPRAPGMRPSQW